MISVNLNRAEFAEEAASIIRGARRPAGVLAVGGRAGANYLRKYFLKKDQTDANKLSDRRQHLWQQIAHAVQAPVVDAAGNKITITVNHPVIAQKVFGGPITAKRGQNLAIPEEEQAYGRSPSVFERETGLKLILITANDHAFLAARIDPNSKALQVEYLLTPRVDQQKDETALPNEQEWQQAIIPPMQQALDRQLKEGKNE